MRAEGRETGGGKMARWDKEVRRLPADHGWEAAPGYCIFVMDRGAARFDYPDDWVFQPDDDGLKIYDRTPPDDNCRLQVSLLRLRPEVGPVDWSGLSLPDLLLNAVREEGEAPISRQRVREIKRSDLDLVWLENRYLDPNEHRPARTRVCLARGANIHCLLTLDFWADDAARLGPIWDHILASLRLGEFV